MLSARDFLPWPPMRGSFRRLTHGESKLQAGVPRREALRGQTEAAGSPDPCQRRGRHPGSQAARLDPGTSRGCRLAAGTSGAGEEQPDPGWTLAMAAARTERGRRREQDGGNGGGGRWRTPWPARPGPRRRPPFGPRRPPPLPPLLRVTAREPARAGSRALYEPSRASTTGSRKHRAEPGSARSSAEPRRAEPSPARLGSFPALGHSVERCPQK